MRAIRYLFANGEQRSSVGINSRGDGRRAMVDGLLWLGFAFTGLALIQLAIVNNELKPTLFLPLFVLIGCGGTATYLLQRQHRLGDPVLLPLVFLLSGLGLVMITRLAPAFITPQLLWLTAATVALLGVALLPRNLTWLYRYKYVWLSGGLVLLAATLVFGVNPSGYGPRLWLPIGPIYFQPSEPLKLLLIIFLAAYMADRRRELVEVKAYIGPVPMPHPSYWGPMVIMWGLSMVLLVWQRDLGAAFLFFCTFLGMLYAAIGKKRYLWAGAVLLLGAGSLGYILFDVVRIRIEAFWNPWADPAGRSFQIVQSLLAFASGGFFGQGLGQGLPTAIPVVHSDFVYAAIGEEYGLLGALAVLLCFMLLVGRAFSIALRAPGDFERLLAAGIGVMLSLQTIVISAGALKLMPLTGVTLPFVSYGGSSLVTSFVMVGVLLFIAGRKAGESVNGKTTSIVERSIFNTQHLNLAWGLLTGFLIVAGGLILWQIVAAPFLVRRDDNPRPIVAEQQIRRGRMLTADGVTVAQTIMDEQGLAKRRYPYVGLSSVTGYYSIRYGVSGAEATFDPILRGAAEKTAEEVWLDTLLHRPMVGQDVTLTINLPAQAAADIALGEQEGAVVVIDIKTGAILVVSSHPTYDSNKLDEDWEVLRKDKRAPLLNRATQGLFPVGDLARLVGLIGLSEAGATIPPDPLAASLEEMLAPLSRPGYAATARQLGLIQPLPGLPSQIGRLPDFDNRGTVRDLAATPLHLARMMAALQLEGQLPRPILSLETPSERTQAFGPDTAHYILSLLPQADEHIIGLTGQATPKETGQSWLSWFVGLAPAEAAVEVKTETETKLVLDPSQIISTTPTPLASTNLLPRYAVVAVVVTDKADNEVALRVARAPMRAILEK